MRIPPLSREQSRAVDRLAIERYGMSGLVLMENAGRGSAEVIDRLAPAGSVTILCGRGNNGGDGYVIARHLELLGREVQVISVVPLDQLRGDAASNAGIATASQIDIRVLTDSSQLIGSLLGANTIVDCLLGTGAKGEPREPYRTAVVEANESAAIRIAIDVPSGLDCDSGQDHDPTFRAGHTITFVASKRGFEVPSAASLLGEVHVIGIGVPRKLLEEIARDHAP